MPQLFGLARLGRDAELRTLPNGDHVANLSLAFAYGRKGENNKRPTTWVDGSLWGKRAESLIEYLKKGSLVAVTLEDVHIQTYKTRDGGEGSKIAGKVTAIDLAGGGQAAPPPPPPAPRPPPPPHRPNSGFEDMDDDIPF